MRRWGGILLAAMLGLSGCVGATEPTQIELVVSAAASMTDCMDELVGIYQAAHPQVRILCNYGASGTLAQQIEQGAPVDLFISAGAAQMDALLEAERMLADTVEPLLENRVVLIVPASAPQPTDFAALADEGYGRIGVGEPGSVPVGQYTAQIFETLGLTEALRPRLIFAKDVREVLSWVETGNVDAGVVYETDAKIGKGIAIACDAPEGSHDPVRYPAGVVATSRYPKEAGELLAFLGSRQAEEIYQMYGFTPVKGEADGL